MRPVKKGRYILDAKWHKRHGEEVEIVMVRKGISQSYKGKTIYHVAFDPDEDFRSEDLDEEFVSKNFKPVDLLRCGFDFFNSSEADIEEFELEFTRLKKALKARINVAFDVRMPGELPLNEDDLLCVFTLTRDDEDKLGVAIKLKDEQQHLFNVD